MLQQFLNNNFIQITEDENLNKLKKACDEVIKKVGKDKSKIVSYTLKALDPEIHVQDSSILEVQEIIIKHWSTFLANAKDTAVTYIRAVMLEALESISKDQNLACLIWLTGRNAIKHYNLGREAEILANFMVGLGNQIEENAIENWSLPTESKAEKLAIEIKELTGATIDKSELEGHLKAAAIHSGLGEGGENPQYPSHNALTWPQFFATRTATGITEVINKALKKQAKDISTNQTHIQDAVNKLLNQAQTEIFQKNSLLQMRTQLLWWKEALYSSSVKRSYRELTSGALHVVMANDYSLLVPYLYPVSVDYFLKEVHISLYQEAENTIKFSELISTIKNSADTLKIILPESALSEERSTLLNFVKGIVWNKYSVQQAKNLVGIDEAMEITVTEFALWLFHDMQSLKITLIK